MLCCLPLQEYIRRQLEEEQRQLEILQQQLLHEQALLLVMGKPRASHLLCVHPLCVCVPVRVPQPASPRGGILQACGTSKVLWRPNTFPALVGHLKTLETLVVHSLVTLSLCET